ncbi:hypothetical protein [Paenibacillus glycinis]|uniref:Uncharacterized protein n=1 Tax=Paenibacillus glycinis TaxID=2697035 RepID=A0ABW9XSN1_9BACL|nr:hypothetical protein [Paenibacillus glycinis]NBD25630.1 hypothetical protein [Paenibacillus glycinis]
MSDAGIHSQRGYKIQTIITLLEAFQQNQWGGWTSFTLEPIYADDKIDIPTVF